MNRTKYDRVPWALSPAVRCISSSSWRTCLLRLFALAACVGILPLMPAVAATYTVTNLHDPAPEGIGGLRDAIAAANGTPADDMIVFAPGLNGTVTLTIGELTIADNGTLSIDGEGRITVSGNDTSRVFFINTNATPSLNSLTITQGRADHDGVILDSGGGGGIYNLGTLTITNSTLNDNAADIHGAGIHNNGGTVTITNSTLSDNSSVGFGGGIYNSGTVTVAGSTLSDNSATSGGGIENRRTGTATIINSTLSGNSVSDFIGGGNSNGGGISNGGTLTITDSTLSGNSARFSGGGIYNGDGGTLTITDSTLSGNSARFSGGGIYNFSGMLTITNSTLSDNLADLLGGGINNSHSGTLTITDSTLSGNSALDSGGGIYNIEQATIANTIIANSISGSDCVRNGGTINAQNSLIEDGLDCVNGTNINNLTGDPSLGALTGSLAYFPLLADSIAIDAGDNSLIPRGITTDQAGNPRIQNGTVDMGSFEFQVAPPPPAEVEEIPTLGQAALVMLGLLLSVLGVAALRRGA